MPAIELLHGLLLAAVERLPPGWDAELQVAEASVEVRLVDAKGRRLPAVTLGQRGRVFAAYAAFADKVYRLQRFRWPELEDQLGWGGNFTGREGGRYLVAHWDLGGFRGSGRYRRPERGPSSGGWQDRPTKPVARPGRPPRRGAGTTVECREPSARHLG